MSDAKTVQQPESDKRTSTILGPISNEDTVQMASASDPCFWNDEQFKQGDRVNHDGKCYECSFGNWVEAS